MMKLKYMRVSLLVAIAVLTGCVASGSKMEPKDEAAEIRYYIGKLPDREYVKTYGGDEHPRPWYTAAEALGQIGKPAIPALMERLDTPDPYELMLSVYALMLASQDPALMAETGNDYLVLDVVLTQGTNEENKRRALDWWKRYHHLFP